MKHKRRKVELVVLSDIHLGTYGCRAEEVGKYLKSIAPKTLILNGDIVDIWQFKKRYWPKTHMEVVKQIIGMAAKGTKVYYITGNHDENMRKLSGLQMGNLQIVNKLELTLDGERAWFFHGDVFDIIMQNSKWLAKLGAIGYDFLILLNVVINKLRKFFGKEKVSFSKRIKDNVKSAVKYINDFEESAAKLAIQKGFDQIICGHIHHPDDRIIRNEEGKSIRYLNSGDWIENLTALEYHKKNWRIFQYQHDFVPKNSSTHEIEPNGFPILNNKELFKIMVDEIQN